MPHPKILNYFIIEIKPTNFKTKKIEEKTSFSLWYSEFSTVHISKSNYSEAKEVVIRMKIEREREKSEIVSPYVERSKL